MIQNILPSSADSRELTTAFYYRKNRLYRAMRQGTEMRDMNEPTAQNPATTPRDQSIERASSPFAFSSEQVTDHLDTRARYLEARGKADKSMFVRSSIDLRHGVELERSCPFQSVIAGMIDAPTIQRLRWIGQLSAAWMVYPDAVHSRLTHVLGSANLTAETLLHLHSRASANQKRELEIWGPITVAFALCHDLGHAAPGSHLAQRVFFPNCPDSHEEVTHRIFREDEGFRTWLDRVVGVGAAEKLDKVAEESSDVPRWTYQLVTGGGWNTDRGDWVPRDSHHCGVTYGFCEPKMIIRNLQITDEGELVITESGVSAIENFFQARTHMYRDVYFHGTSRLGEKLVELLVQRAREINDHGQLKWADDDMRIVLTASDVRQLSLDTIYNMTESWWTYHVQKWAREPDPITSDLAQRILLRHTIFKEWDLTPENAQLLRKMVETSDVDPRYYYVELAPMHIKVAKDLKSAMRVKRDNGELVPLTAYSEVLAALSELSSIRTPGLIGAPMEIWRGKSIN